MSDEDDDAAVSRTVYPNPYDVSGSGVTTVIFGLTYGSLGTVSATVVSITRVGASWHAVIAADAHAIQTNAHVLRTEGNAEGLNILQMFKCLTGNRKEEKHGVRRRTDEMERSTLGPLH